MKMSTSGLVQTGLVGLLCLSLGACVGSVSPGAGTSPSTGTGSGAGTNTGSGSSVGSTGTGGGSGSGSGTGSGTGSTGTGSGGNGTAVTGTFLPGPSRLRRLTSFEYRNSVIDLLGAGTTVTTEFDPDPALNNLTSLAAAQLSYPQPVTEDFEASAQALAAALVKDTTRRAKVVTCTPTGATDQACLTTFVTSFGKRAFRRPLTTQEVDLYVGVGKTAMTMLTDFWGGVQYALAGLLQSPNFLYRTEIGVADSANPKRRALDQYELASRLSYMLWGTTPDDALLAAADGGALGSADGLKKQSDRLLASPRTQDAVIRMFSEMLDLSSLDSLVQLPSIYPAASSTTLGASMRTETQTMLKDIIFTRNAPYTEFFTGNKTFLNAELAKLYGVTGVTGTGFTATTFPADSPRSGFLTQGSFLALNAKSDNTSPTHRGKFIIETLLCNSIPPPPMGVSTILGDKDKSKTMRDQLIAHQADPSCAACHKIMDPMGLALEHFDGIGAYRETDRGMAVDVTGSYGGVNFNGAKELGAALAGAIKTGEKNPETADCLVRNLFRIATGHLETNDEQPGVVALSNAFTADGFHVGTAFSQLVASEAFRFVGQPE